MSKLKLSKVEEILDGNESYSTIVDYLRLSKRYGTKIKFSAIDAELLEVLGCSSYPSVSGKLTKLWNIGLVIRTHASEQERKKWGSVAYLYTMN